ncbi:uncharacterized protein LOC106384662 [Brassica napus]|uniref:uncharacterized protein LOC106384662 n=1 Tax=Brassica napus TaxID=3708 RepID=UPI0006AADB0E|nr:uncharacterized protein LOC106384662 [Brassica napus]
MSSSSSDEVDEALDEIVDEVVDNYIDSMVNAQTNKPKRRSYIERERELGHKQLWKDYFAENPTYQPEMFRRRFRMNKTLFLRIVQSLSTELPYFQQRRNAHGRLGLSALQKFTAAIRMMAYGQSGDMYDKYLRLGESTSRLCLDNFTNGILQLFGAEYLRRPTPADLQRLLDVGEARGFPGMVGSIDCMHWEWKNCPTAWRGQFTRGSGKPTIVLEAVASQDLWIWHAFFGLPGRAPKVNNHTYHMAYYLTDGIYPHWATFIQSIPLPQGPKAVRFAERQEATRKDVERAFGVLQSRFAIVKNPALQWDKEKIGRIMRCCVILHNMIVENERDGYNQIDTSEFESGESSRSSQVRRRESLNVHNMLGIRTEVRNSDKHDRLKADLIENIWQMFGNVDD